MSAFPKSLQDKLNQRKADKLLRSLTDRSDLIDFYSNDYLGLSQVKTGGDFSEGSTGSRLISGNSARTEQIEAELSDFFGHEASLFFNSGYDANLGLFSSVPQRNDTVIYDQLVHASIRDGIAMSKARSFNFRHNDLSHLQQKLKQASGEVYVVVESVYSMDGDTAPLADIAEICKNYNAHLVVDEAHAGGLIGEEGKGVVAQLNLQNSDFATIITFGKAYGSHGALVLGSSKLKQYLLNFARPLIYSTALPPFTQERILNMVRCTARMSNERETLKSLINYFKAKIGVNHNLISSNSPIQSLIIGGNEATLELAERLVQEGFAVKAILSPTVPAGSERIRFCLHSYNSKAEIDALTKILNG